MTTSRGRARRVLVALVVCAVALGVSGVRGLAASAYSAAVFADGPGIYYRLGDATGTTAIGSANNLNGVYNGGVTLGVPGALAGDADTSVTLNGSTGYISNAYAGALTNTFSDEIWLKTTTNRGGSLFSEEDMATGGSTVGPHALFMVNSGQLVFGVGTTTRVTLTTPASYNNGAWHHVVAAFDSTTGLTIFVDGASVATNPGTYATGTCVCHLRVGNGRPRDWAVPVQPSSDYFGGTIDEAAAYTKALTLAQVTAHYSAQSHPSPPGSPTATVLGSNQVRVSWTAAAPGGVPITGYAVSGFIGALLADTVTAASSATSITLSGLDGSKAYTFKVYALDANGPGPAATTASVTVTGAAVSYRASVLADNPYGYWRLDDVSGTVATDSSTAGNTGTYVSGVSPLQPGLLSPDGDVSANFDGSSGYMTSAIRETSPSIFTVEAWFQTNTTTGGRIIGQSGSQFGQSGQFDRHIYMTNSGQLVFGVYNTGYKVATSPLSYSDGLPHMAVATLSAAGQILYVDGVQVAIDPNTVVNPAINGYWRIGYDHIVNWPGVHTSEFFKGTIDEAAAYPTALSAARILAHYQAAAVPTLTLTGLTPSFTLTGNANATVTSIGAVSLKVTTTDPRGYDVTVQGGALNLNGVAGGNNDKIPIGNLLASDGGANTFSALSSTVALNVHGHGTASAGGGDTITTDYRITIPFVNSDTYWVTLTYVATTR